MPPLGWVNNCLSQKKELFKIEFIEKNMDFFIRSIDKDKLPIEE